MYKPNKRTEKHEAKTNRFRNRKFHYCILRNWTDPAGTKSVRT